MRFKRPLLGAATVAAVALATVGVAPQHSAEASTVQVRTANVAFTGWPTIACANEGPARAYPSAGNSTKRNCWWGYEVLFSKNDSKLILAGAQGAAGLTGLATKRLIPPALAEAILVAAIGGGPITAAAANNAIDDGHCLKLTVIYPLFPFSGSYQCS